MFDDKIKELEKMETNTQKLKVSMIYMIIFMFYNIILYIIPGSQFEIWVKVLAIFSVFLFGVDTAFFMILRKKLFSVAYIFVALSFLFHIGQVILHAFFEDYNYIITDCLKMYPQELTRNALFFSINIIQIVTFFILLSTDTKRKRESRRPRFNKINNEQIRIIGWILFIITVPMKFVYIKTAISVVQDDTYVSSTVAGFSGIYIQISNFCIISFVILLLAYSYNKIMQIIILGFGVSFFVWSMLSGGRIYSVISILILFLCYINTNNISSKKIVLIVAFGVLLLQLITSITYIRTTHDFNIISLIQYAFNPANNFILKTLDEFGGTVATVIFTFDEVPRYVDFHKGLSYIKAWMLVGLNINGVLEQISREVAYTLILSRKFNLGGSYIGELYYNFGYLGYVFSPVIGLFIGKLSEISDYCLEKRLVIEFALLVMPIYASISWIRGYFNSFPRASVWGGILILFLYAICRKLNVKRCI